MISIQQRERDFIQKLALIEQLGPVSKYKVWQAAHRLQIFSFPELLATVDFGGQIKTIVEKKLADEEFSLSVEYFINSYPVLTIIDERYPQLLRETAYPPLLLHYLGSLDLLETKMLAVVGSRQMTDYGEKVINNLIPPVVKAGVTIVSGLARGVDSTAQRLALRYGGKVVAIIGCGITQAYPAENEALQRQLELAGLVLSEYPLGAPPLPHHFPERNRIIAGLAHTCLVVESAQKSGTLITANIALRENRNVCAVPGPIDSPYSVGCNELIETGARPILKPVDLLDELDAQLER